MTIMDRYKGCKSFTELLTTYLYSIHIHISSYPMFSLHVLSVNGKSKILRHDAVFIDNFYTGRFKVQTELPKWFISVKLGTVEETSRPGEYGGNWICRGFFSFLVFTIMAGHSS